MSSSATTLPATLKLLSDPTRLRLLALLSQEELVVQELVAITGLQQSRVSNHLSLLKRARLVRDRREGSWSFHSLVPPAEDAALTPGLFDAVLRPYLASESGRADGDALERVREQRRQRSRLAHDALASRGVEIGHEFAYGSLRAEALAAIAPRTWTIADLGCGAGFLTEYLAPRSARVIAIDHAERMLATARERVMASNVEFRSGDLEALPLADGEVDAAFANLVWHHVGDMDRAARELFRVLKDGGIAVVTDLLPHDQDWLRERMGDLRLGLRPEVVASALGRAGFSVVEDFPVVDRYRAKDPAARPIDLPLFLVRAVRTTPQS